MLGYRVCLLPIGRLSRPTHLSTAIPLPLWPFPRHFYLCLLTPLTLQILCCYIPYISFLVLETGPCRACTRKPKSQYMCTYFWKQTPLKKPTRPFVMLAKKNRERSWLLPLLQPLL